jgi:glycosyltransferase involved in cell wall biosynthesis
MAQRTPRIGLNAHLLSLSATYRGAGVSHYIDSLLRYLPQADQSLNFLAFVGDESIALTGWERHVSCWHTARPPARILWEQSAQPWGAWRKKLDLLHVPVNVGPIIVPCPVVVTIHDLSFYLYPELFQPAQRTYLQHMTRQTVTRAARVIAISENTRADIVRILGVSEDQVAVIPLGLDAEMRPVAQREPIEALRQRRGLPEHMLLFLGTLEPRKNITTLLEAYALLRRQPGWVHRLVIAGGKGWYYDAIYATAERLGLRDDVLFAGFVPQEELPLWYNAAEVFVYPSLYEGFGWPTLEAMACGTPVVASNTSALPEVVGDAGLLVDPHDAQALATAIASVAQDPARAASLRQAGLARAQQYSWYDTAHKTCQLYHQVLER